MKKATKKYQGMFMGPDNWTDVAVAFKKNWPVVIPLGAGTKPHGFHLPNDTDEKQAEYYADWVAQNYPVCIAPNIPYFYYPAFVNYPGSGHISVETSTNLIVELCETWHKQGAQLFYVLNMGISTNTPLAAAKKILTEKKIAFDYFDLSTLDDHPDIKRIMLQKYGTHADQIETAAMLVIDSNNVHMEKAVSEDTPKKPGPLTPDVTATDKHVSVSGAWGNPLLATKEHGEIVVRVVKDMLKRDLEKLLNPQPSLGSHPQGLHTVTESNSDAKPQPTLQATSRGPSNP